MQRRSSLIHYTKVLEVLGDKERFFSGKRKFWMITTEGQDNHTEGVRHGIPK